MRFSFKFFLRDFRELLTLPDIQITPTHWGNVAIGGPEYAILEATGPEAALWGMVSGAGWLRYGVEIYNDLGTAIWWGYVESATLSTPQVSVSVSMEDVANSVAVEYGTGNTGFSENAASVAEYGRKQKTISVGSELAASVSQRQTTELGYSGSPRPVQDIRQNDTAAVTLRCVGWLKTLGWLYYSQADGQVEYVGTGSRDQIFGMGITSSQLWFSASDRQITDTDTNLYDFKKGMKIAVSGSASNDGNLTITAGTTQGPAGGPGPSCNFDGTNTIYLASGDPGKMAWMASGDRIVISNTASNNAWFRVTERGPSYAAMYLELAEAGTTEGPVTPTFWRGHFISVAETTIVEEKPGASVTLTVDGSKIAQQFVPTSSWNCETISIKIKKIGTPTDGVQVALRTDTAGSPTWPPVATQTVASASISTNSAWTDFTFSSAHALTAAATYWFVVERTGSADPENYYSIALDEDAGYGAGYLRLWNGTAWVARTVEADTLFRVLGTEETTAQIAAIVSGAGQFLTGTVVENVSGVSTNQYRAGIVDALTELTELMDIGTSNGRRLLCAVTQARALRVWEEPAYSGAPDYIRRLSGEIVSFGGVPLQPGELISGKWLQVEVPQMPGAGVNVNSTLLFIERCEYDATTMEYTITPSGAPNIWRLSVVPRQG